jgi:curved DNA-binding protein
VEFQDYYKTLGVNRDATADEIHKAFRKLARQYHPDVSKSPDAETQFKRVNEAYEVLKDPEKRKRYDSLGRHWKAGQQFTPPPGFSGFRMEFGQGDSFGGFSDFFQNLFGDLLSFQGQRRPRGPGFGQRGSDHEAVIEVSLEELAKGAKKTIQLERHVPDGRGHVTRKRVSYDVRIPRGITDGSKIRLSGQGGEGTGGMGTGDLFLTVRLRPDSRFRVDGFDLVTSVDITPWEAALGTRVTIATLENSVAVKIPAGTPSGRTFRLKDKGLPRLSGEPGDLLVSVRIVVPTTLSKRERELFEELASESSFQPRSSA